MVGEKKYVLTVVCCRCSLCGTKWDVLLPPNWNELDLGACPTCGSFFKAVWVSE